MVFPISGEQATTSPQAYTVNWASASITLVEGTTINISLGLDRLAEQTLVLNTTIPTTPAGVTINWPGVPGEITVPQGSSIGNVSITAGPGILNAQVFAFTLLASTQIVVGITPTTTVTTQVITSGSEVGVPWIGGLGVVSRQLLQATFSLGQGEARQTAYAIGAEDCQVDLLMEMGAPGGTGRKNLNCTGFIATDGAVPGTASSASILGSGSVGTPPAEAGSYDVSDPWTGLEIRIEGLPAAVGATGDRATATFTSPIDSFMLLGSGAVGNSGPDLMQKECRMAYAETGLSAPLARPLMVIVFATRCVDRDYVMYEVMITNSFVDDADTILALNDTQPGPVTFESLEITLPTDATGYPIAMLDDFTGNGGHDISSGQIVKPFTGSDVHRIDSGMVPSWTLLAHNSLGATQATAILEGRNCGIVVEGFGNVCQLGKGLGSHNTPILNWTNGGAPQVSYAQLDSEAEQSYDYWRNGVISGDDTGVFTSERVGWHLIASNGQNGGTGPTLIHSQDVAYTAAPNEVAALRYHADAISRRYSNAVFKADEARPLFSHDHVVSGWNEVAQKTIDYTLLSSYGVQLPAQYHSLPLLTLASWSSSNNRPGYLIERAFADDDGGSRTEVEGQSWGTEGTYTAYGWSPDAAHLSRAMGGRDAWLVTKSGIGWMLHLVCASYGQRFNGAYPPAPPVLGGAPGVTDGQRNTLFVRSTFTRVITAKGSARPLVYKFNTQMQTVGGSLSFTEVYVDSVDRNVGWASVAFVDGLSLVKDATLRAALHPPREADPLEEKCFMRHMLYASGHLTSHFGLCSFRDYSQGSPDGYLVSVSNPAGQPYNPQRNVANQRGALPSGLDHPSSEVSTTPPDGIKRRNYDTDPTGDQEQARSYSATWQANFHATAVAIALEHLLAEGESPTDMMITDALPVLETSYWFLRAQENHPAATASWLPPGHYMTNGPGTEADNNPLWTPTQILDGSAAWWYDVWPTSSHYFFYGAVGFLNTELLYGLTNGDSMLRLLKKYVGQGTLSDEEFRDFLKDDLWGSVLDGRINSTYQFDRNKLYVLGWLNASLSSLQDNPLAPWAPSDIAPVPAP